MRVLFLCGVIALGGCASMPPLPPPRPDTQVNASFGKTWDAVVDYFARSSIPVKTIDRSSGLIAAETTRLAGDNSTYGVCANGWGKRSFPPLGGSFNALVRGDSLKSVVRVTAVWLGGTGGCQTTDVWERDFESTIKSKAEGGQSK